MTPLQTIGKYEILRLLGKGAMGEVYLGRDPLLGRSVAIKVIQASTAFDAEGPARFEREARATAALNHPHIVTIFDFGVVEGGHFLAMEYLEGEDLDALIRQGRHGKGVLLEALAQACEGLGYAHARGIIHRDVKPGNILVAFDGERPWAKLLDFGVASVDRSNLTETGVRMGTVGYMAPEYLESGSATPGSDLFAAGVIIYEILSGGRMPFRGEGTTAILSAILRKPPEPLGPGDVEGIPAAVLDVMDRALAKDPAHRFARAEELAAALREALRQPLSRRGTQRIVVGKGGDCLSLRVALRQARPGAVVTVLPGHYKETVRVDKEVSFQGEGDPETILVGTPSGPALVVETPACAVRGLSLLPGEGGVAVECRSGKAELQACRIGGLRVAGGASAVLEDCALCGTGRHPGALLEQGAALRMARTRVQGPGGLGLRLHPGARAEAQDSSFEGSPAGSAELGEGSSARFLRCRFLGSRSAGLLLLGGARAELEGCELRGHEGAGLHAAESAQATLAACRILENGGMGLSAVDGARLEMEGCEIAANGQPGLLLHRRATARLSRCQLVEGRSLGIACRDGASLALDDCLLRGNALGGLLLGPGAEEPELGGDNLLEDAVLR